MKAYILSPIALVERLGNEQVQYVVEGPVGDNVSTPLSSARPLASDRATLTFAGARACR
jgi:hypothetical protein